MMKQMIRQATLYLVLAGAASKGQAQTTTPGFILNGTLTHMRAMPSKIYLVYDSLAHKATDSSLVKAGKYSFKGSIDFPAKAYLTTKLVKGIEFKAGGAPTIAGLFVDKGTMTAVSTGELTAITLTGSAADKDYWAANQSFNLLMDTVKKSAQVVKEMDGDWLFMNALTATLFSSTEPRNKEKMAFVHKHPAASVNPYLLNELLHENNGQAGYVDRLDSFYQAMPVALQQSKAGEAVGSSLKNALKAVVGHQAAGFALKDTLGNTVSLSSFKGQYVLVQFWNNNDPAMRNMLSTVTQTYQAYKDKGLTVLGVSVGLSEADWKQALRGYHFAWKNVVDVPGANTVAELYGITDNQNNVLIDPNGIIVARNLAYPKLGEKIAAILD
jgi:peroxiredoxin